MKKASIILSALFLNFIIVKCTPAVEDQHKTQDVSSHPSAEEKDKMEEQAKLIADSVATALSASTKTDTETAAPADAHAGH